MALELPAPIALGRTAEIFPWGDNGHILKLYHDWCPPNWVEYEAKIARIITQAGIPSPAVDKILEMNGRRGIIYERVDGISMLQDMNMHPWTIWKHARSLAELQVKVNQLSVPDLPSYKNGLKFAIRRTPRLETALREQALAKLETLSDGQNLCHGDFHPGNVIITAKGPVVIDWMTACRGSRWADVARAQLLLTIGAKGAGKQVSPVILLFVRLFHNAYLFRYLALIPDQKHELENWSPVIAAARLDEQIEPERKALLEMIGKGLAKSNK